MDSRRAFTLIELLVVIAIIAILAVVVVLTLNPAQLLAQSRDANRVSDMATLNSAINLYSTDQSGAATYSLGTASTSYISIPSASSSCATLGLATSAFSYACSTSANYRIASSSGWLPLNFQNISAGAPFGNLPVDPVNASSSNLYYSYETNGTTFVLSSFMESQKYAKNMATTGGTDPALYQIGSGASTLPDATRGLVGYWPLNEGTGSSTIDWSGYGNTGTWNGTSSGANGYYSQGYISQWAGFFNAANNDVSTTLDVEPSAMSQTTWTAWIYPTSITGTQMVFSDDGGGYGRGLELTRGGSGSFTVFVGSGGTWQPTTPTLNQWQFVAVTYAPSNVYFYKNGVQYAYGSSPTLPASSYKFTMGNDPGSLGQSFSGEMNDVRVYDRALSAAEIQEIYNAEK